MRVSDGADSSGTLPEASDAAHLQRPTAPRPSAI